MVFTSFDYLAFVVVAFGAYWLLPIQYYRNIFLLAASYFFYGYVHHWFCFLIAGTTLVNFAAGLLIERYPQRKKSVAAVAVAATLGQLCVFKYFDFFAESVQEVLGAVGIQTPSLVLNLFLPVGISFFTFQALSYTVDVYRKELAPRKNIVDFALFVSFFPQLVAGPIERAGRLLTQFETKRVWKSEMFLSAWPLLLNGYLKKIVIADNVSIYADKVFSLKHPSLSLLIAGSLAFTVQIYADFSAYTDIARGTARLFGVEIIRNFNAPYSAVSPSDFWRRWHISFSTWIRDYLYIPLGGSRVDGQLRVFGVLLATFALSGLWHGASWHFVFWGVYHALLLFVYRGLGFSGRWQPEGSVNLWIARAVMFVFTVAGWSIFRAPSMSWLLRALGSEFSLGLSGDPLSVSLLITAWTCIYAILLLIAGRLEECTTGREKMVRAVFSGVAIVLIFVFIRDGQQDFIYFQF